jgi:sirohydrochlorin ferrochelatase
MRLVTVAHGTRDAAGNRVAAELTAAAGRRLGLTAVASYVELCEPAFASVLRRSAEPTVVVPLLLSTGFHLRHDLPEAIEGAPGPVVLGHGLGPDPLLAAAQADRLRATGAEPGQPVVMVAAGSNDPLAARDLSAAARLLAEAWHGSVALATLSGPGTRPAELVTPDHAVSPYLLAPGYFARRTAAESSASPHVAAVIGPHPLVGDLVLTRATELVAGERRSA